MKAFVLLSLVVLVGCSNADQKPDGVLDRDTFKELLIGSTLIEARMNHELITEHLSQVPVDRYYDELFKEFGVSSADFERTFDYYAERPEEMRSIYEEMLTELSLRKDAVPQAPPPSP